MKKTTVLLIALICCGACSRPAVQNASAPSDQVGFPEKAAVASAPTNPRQPKDDVASLGALVKQVKTQKEEAEKQVEDLRRQIKAKQSEYEEQLKDSRNQLDSAKSQSVKLLNENTALKAEVKDVKAEQEKVMSQFQQAQTEIAELKSKRPEIPLLSIVKVRIEKFELSGENPKMLIPLAKDVKIMFGKNEVGLNDERLKKLPGSPFPLFTNVSRLVSDSEGRVTQMNLVGPGKKKKG